MMQLRKHQRDVAGVVDEILAGAPIRNIIVRACPGSGKSLLPVIMGRLITAGLADALCWICPRQSLQQQGEEAFVDPTFREMLGHKLTVRSSTNDVNPLRGHAGFTTTYQALSVDADKTAQAEFERRRYILVLDEWHHLSSEADRLWTDSIKPLVDRAEYILFMTGTLQRANGEQIAFIEYDDAGRPILENSGDSRFIDYPRSVALAEKAIIPLRFHLHDGHAIWENKDGHEISARLAKVKRKDAGSAIYTALSTEYARELIGLAFDHWKAHRRSVPNAKLLVVTAGLKQAQEALKFLKDRWHTAEIATSHESEACKKTIKKFRTGDLSICVSIAVPYEGLDVKAISHIACLTHIRSEPWIEQCISRAVRIDPAAGPYETQVGYIFAPDDPLFRNIVNRIQAEQIASARVAKEKEDAGLLQLELFKKERPEGESNPYKITPLSSELTGRRELALGGNGKAPAPAVPVQMTFPKTPSEIEQELRESIEQHVRLYEFNNRIHPPGKLNREILAHFQKPRPEMTIRELEAVQRHIRRAYPLNYIRGTGRKRVPTKAQPWTPQAQKAAAW